MNNKNISDDFFESEYEDIPNEVYEYYSIDRWVVDVLDMK